MKLIRPDAYFVSVLDIRPEDLIERGIRGVILDLDNTLLPRTMDTVPEQIADWVFLLEEAGLQVVVVSNNFHERGVRAAASIGAEFVGKAMKPFRRGLLSACERMNLAPSEVLCVGDQTYTDILGAHLCGMQAWLVQPLVKQDLKHTKLLRVVDRIALRGMKPEGGSMPVFDIRGEHSK